MGEQIVINDQYMKDRANLFASHPLKDQLDRLWHDIDDGLFGEPAKTGLFYQLIKSIKDAKPKEV